VYLQLLVACVIASVLLPARYLPAMALAVWALVPVTYLPGPVEAVRYLHPSVVTLTIWLVRGAGRWRASPGGIPAVLGLLSVLVASSTGSENLDRSLSWSLNVLVLLTIPLLAGEQPRAEAAVSLLKVMRVVTLGLAVFAIVEYTQMWNPFAHSYMIGGQVIGQRWSVYRVQTLLGHPLMNAVFFAVTSTMFLAAAVNFRGRRDWGLAALSLLALWATGSRGGLLALAIGITVFVLAVIFARGASVGTRSAVLLGATLGAGLVATFGWPTVRNSGEGAESMSYRLDVLERGLTLWRESPWLGTGPGTSQQALEGSGTHLVVESSAVQLLISVGLLGLLVIGGTIVVQMRSSAGRPAGLVAMAVVVAAWTQLATFNALDAIPAVLVLPCCAVLATPALASSATSALHQRVELGPTVRHVRRAPRMRTGAGQA
jgi:O-antigen ligase